MQARNSPRALRDGLKAVPCILLISVLVSAQTPTAANWSQFRGDARLTGIADGAVYVGSAKGELLAIELESGKLRWKYSTGEGGFIGESSPAVGADAVYVGDLAGVVHAVGIRDGRRLWTFRTDGEVRSSPV